VVKIICRVCSGVDAAHIKAGVLKNSLHAANRGEGTIFVLDCDDRSDEIGRNP
jgi:hypothetical protein